MKVLIVDDEPHLIHAIKALVPWQEYDIDKVLSATTAAEARELLSREQPQLAFFDTMIGDERGTDLMNYVVEQKISSKVIAISGYSDFEYVRSMLVLGCVDYLLKPLERTALLAAVEKAVNIWKEDRRKNDDARSLLHQINYLSSERRHTLLSQLLSPAASQAAYQELSSLSDSFSKADTCLIFYSDLTFYPSKEDAAFQRSFTAFFDMMKTDLESRGLGAAILRHWNPHDAAVILYGRTDRGLNSVQTAVSHFRRQSGYPFHFGCCSGSNRPEDILSAYDSARRAFYSMEVNQNGRTPLITMLPGFFHTTSPADDRNEAQLLSSIMMNEEMTITVSVQQWLSGKLLSAPVTYGTIKRISTDFETMYSHWCGYFTERYPGFTPGNASALTPCSLFDEAYHFQAEHAASRCREILMELAANLHDVCRSGDVFRQIGSYLEINYNQPFDQTEYAELFHMNKDYLCRKFKEAYGVSMVTRLNEIRIEHAKKLLRSSNAKITDIAIQIGYNDEKYFIRTFKKCTGMTPNEYRHSK